MHCLPFQDLSEKLAEQELQFRRLSQEQVDNYTLDINTAYARLRGIEQAVQSKHMDLLQLISSALLLRVNSCYEDNGIHALTLGNKDAKVPLINFIHFLEN